MHLTITALLLAAIHAVLRLAIPPLRRSLHAATVERAPRAAGRLAAVQLLSSATLIMALSLGVTALVLWLLSLLAGNSAGAVADTLAMLRSARGTWLEWTPAWGLLAGSLLLLALLLFAYRRSRVRCTKAIAAAHEREFAVLVEQARSGTLEQREPTPQMQELLARRQQALAALQQAEAGSREATAIGEFVQQAEHAILSIDLMRRLSPRVDTGIQTVAAPTSFWGRVQTFFISQGLLEGMGRISRATFVVGLVLLMPCLLGATRDAGDTALGERIASLEELRLRLTAAEAQRDWETARGESKDAVALTAEEEAAIDGIAREWEIRQAEAPVLAPVVAAVAPTFANRSGSVRARLLARTTTARPGVLQALTDVDVHPLAEASLEPKPQTATGRHVADELRAKARSSPSSFRDRLRTEWTRFQQPATAAQLRRAAAVQVSAALADGTAADTMLGDLGRNLDANHRESMRLYRQQSADRFLSQIASGQPVDDALARAVRPEDFDALLPRQHVEAFEQHVRERSSQILERQSEIETGRRERPASLATRSDAAASRRAADAIASHSARTRMDPSAAVHLTESLSEYRDYFPGQLNEDQRTARAELTRRLQNGEPMGGSRNSGRTAPRTAPHAPSPRVARASFTRARSFAGLRGFRRVGGVLIGREPRSDGRAAFREIRWTEVDADHLELVLLGVDGAEYRSRPHDKRLIALALAYAADGRPLAVTMTTAAPLAELRILLHPALVDTELGGRIVDLDRLVDTHGGDHEPQQRELEIVSAHALLYRLAWAMRLDAAAKLESLRDVDSILAYLEDANHDLFQKMRLELSLSESDQAQLEAVQRAAQMPELAVLARRLLADPDLDKALAAAIELGAIAEIDEQSLLVMKHEFYDRKLVDMLRDPSVASAKSTEDLRFALASMLQNSVHAPSARHAKMPFVLALATVPPNYEPWSGVRERDYPVDGAHLVWAKDSPLGPGDILLFMRQVAFGAEPQFLDAAVDAADYEDKTPWEFPRIGKGLDAHVLQRSLAAAPDLLAAATEFTMLQRLFRCALDGHLGPDFAVESLAGLGAIVPHDQREQHTPRWNARPGSAEMQTMFALGELELGDEQKPHLDAAVAALTARLDLHRERAEITTDAEWQALDGRMAEWERAFAERARDLQTRASSDAKLAELAEHCANLAMILEVRRSLMVQEEERPGRARQR